MKLYLSSYRLGNRIDVLKEWIENNTDCIFVIPNALDVFSDSERKENSIREKCTDLEEIGFKTQIFDLRNYFNNPDLMKEKLKDVKAFYVLGGNVFVLRQAMKLSGFDEYLISISKNPDYLYAGFSAGICVLAEDLHGIDLADDPSANPYNYPAPIFEGIGLIDFLPVPHFDTKEHKESPLMYGVVEYMQKNNLKYKTLRDGDVIIKDI